MEADPLSVEFVNTRYAVRGRLRESIGAPADLLAWLLERTDALTLADREAELAEQVDVPAVGAFLALRETITGLFAAAAEQRLGTAAELAVLNRTAMTAPTAPALVALDNEYAVVQRSSGAEPLVALSAIARDAVQVLGNPSSGQLRSCQGPGCVLFFVTADPRRKWCSTACGNRARAARHYLRHRPLAPR